MGLWTFRTKLNTQLWEIKRRINKRRYPEFCGNPDKLTILSCNCIGGMVSHTLNMQFCSPTVNLYMDAPDFLKLCENLKDYMELVPEYYKTEEQGYPVMKLGDLLIYGVHYHSPEELIQIWEKRKQRINYENLFLIFTDRDGFCEEMLDRIAALPAPKVLFASREYEGYDFVFVPRDFRGEKQVGNLTLFRTWIGWNRFYEDYPFAEIFRNLKRNKEFTS